MRTPKESEPRKPARQRSLEEQYADSWDRSFRREADEYGNNPDSWFDHAAALLVASNILASQNAFMRPRPTAPKHVSPMHLIRVMSFLRAFTVECLLKGRLLQQGYVLAQNGVYKRIKGINNHDLIALAALVGLTLDKDEKFFLQRLTDYGEGGRYPIEGRYDPQKGPPVYVWSGADEGLFRNLLTRLVPAEAGTEDGGTASAAPSTPPSPPRQSGRNPPPYPLRRGRPHG